MKRVAPLLLLAALAAAGCGSGKGPKTITIQPAHVFAIVDQQPAGPVKPGKTVKIAFAIRQPSGKPLTKFKTGAGPHTGVHLIIVKYDLSAIIHRHPPIGKNGHIQQPVVFPSPGKYRVLVDVYPRLVGQLPNFQLSYDVHAAGTSKPKPLPPFKQLVTVDGYKVVLHGKPKLRAIQAQTMLVTITDPQGKPLVLRPWYGALAHAIFFHEQNLAYFHTHVCGPNTPGCTSILGGTKVTGRSTKPGVLHVGVLLPESGTWELFLQFQGTNGKILTAPFTLHVR